MNCLNVGAVVGATGAALFHQAVVNAHELRVVVKFQDELARAQFCFLPQKHLRAEVPLEFFHGFADVWIEMNFRGEFCSSRAP